MIGRIWAIALNTLRELVRDRVLAVALFFGIAITIFAGVVAAKTPLNWGEVVVNVALGGMNFSLIFIAIIISVTLLSKEIEKKTVFTILTKPLSRSEFLLGKFLGMALTLLAALLIMTVVVKWLCWRSAWPLQPVFYQAVASIYGELIVVASVALLFSSFSTPYVSGLLTLGVWIAGTLAGIVNKMVVGPEDMDLSTLQAIKTVYLFLPDFTRLNLKDRVPYNLPPPDDYFLYAPLFVCMWTASLLTAAILLFDRRDLK